VYDQRVLGGWERGKARDEVTKGECRYEVSYPHHTHAVSHLFEVVVFAGQDAIYKLNVSPLVLRRLHRCHVVCRSMLHLESVS
jgi:hypothetical protein